MAEVQFTGTQTLTYMGFFNEDTGKTLTCEPGGVYRVSPGMPEDGRFVLVEKKSPGNGKTSVPVKEDPPVS